MKDISLASGSLLQALSETPVQTNASREEGASGNAGFTLPDMALDAIGQRVQAAKNGAHEAAHPAREEDDRTAQMQMLLSLFLTQGAQPQPDRTMHLSTQGEAGQLLQTLGQMQHKPGRAASQQGFFADLSTQGDREAASPEARLTSDATPVTISPKMQAALASVLAASPEPRPVTPGQQAELARSAAQDLRAIAPQKAPTRLMPSAGPEGERRVPSHLTKVDKAEVPKTPIAELLLNDTLVKNAPAVDNSRLPVTTVKLDPQSADLGEQLTSLLKDRIQFQLNEQQQTSTIRLDPPSLGKMNISVQLDGGKLVVHIDASQADVSRSLMQLSDNLRQHLTEQNFVQVDVQVSSDGRSQQQPSQQGNQGGSQQQQIVSAVELEGEGSNGKQNESVLIKV